MINDVREIAVITVFAFHLCVNELVEHVHLLELKPVFNRICIRWALEWFFESNSSVGYLAIGTLKREQIIASHSISSVSDIHNWRMRWPKINEQQIETLAQTAKTRPDRKYAVINAVDCVLCTIYRFWCQYLSCFVILMEQGASAQNMSKESFFFFVAGNKSQRAEFDAKLWHRVYMLANAQRYHGDNGKWTTQRGVDYFRIDLMWLNRYVTDWISVSLVASSHTATFHMIAVGMFILSRHSDKLWTKKKNGRRNTKLSRLKRARHP